MLAFRPSISVVLSILDDLSQIAGLFRGPPNCTSIFVNGRPGGENHKVNSRNLL